jgi:hypothetical protein
LAALGVLVVGVGSRLLLAGAGVGDRSAVVMATLLTLGGWAAARLLGGPRVAFAISLGLMALFTLAALPARNPPTYDDVDAFYRTDQVFSAQLAVPGNASIVTVLVEPRSQGAQPSFGLAGTINGVDASWTCPFDRGIQRLALPVPTGALAGTSAADVELHLTGTPSREGDYLLVYASSQRGGYLISLEPTAESQGSVACHLV